MANYLASENEDPAFKLGSNYVPTVRGPYHAMLTYELRLALEFSKLSALSTDPLRRLRFGTRLAPRITSLVGLLS